MDINVKRLNDDGEATVGAMAAPGFFAFTLEDQHQDTKVQGETRIPAGRYLVKPRYHGRFYQAYKDRWGHPYALEIVGVPGFTDVLIHTLNKESQTDGCVGVGWTATVAHAPAEIGTSRPAYLALWDVYDAAFQRREEVWINIEDEGERNV